MAYPLSQHTLRLPPALRTKHVVTSTRRDWATRVDGVTGEGERVRNNIIPAVEHEGAELPGGVWLDEEGVKWTTMATAMIQSDVCYNYSPLPLSTTRGLCADHNESPRAPPPPRIRLHGPNACT
jgi:hypothetical protein